MYGGVHLGAPFLFINKVKQSYLSLILAISFTCIGVRL